MKKKIVFFDGDGTLWYPKTTKYEEKPHWIYHNEKTKDDPNEHIELTPFVVETLRELKEKGITIVILSANPYSPKIANKILKDKVKYFKLTNYIDETHATPPIMKAKGEYILKTLKKFNLNKKDALMVGDTYLWDCKPAKDVGTDALLINSKYRKDCPSGSRAKRVISDINKVLNFV
ncbi:hypothetical protein CMI47_11960 [Candidatus Pacearchaeota archaeon]|nr:hypothetical protein [Candidatus Pacearchaeota archaeon]|tara:strand:- start:833 stop:1363 length:531 start_codon:yes stop_codon:yes gene_type:complete